MTFEGFWLDLPVIWQPLWGAEIAQLVKALAQKTLGGGGRVFETHHGIHFLSAFPWPATPSGLSRM